MFRMILSPVTTEQMGPALPADIDFAEGSADRGQFPASADQGSADALQHQGRTEAATQNRWQRRGWQQRSPA